MSWLDPQIAFRNFQIVVLINSLLGVIEDNFLLITINGNEDEWVITFVVNPGEFVDPDLLENIHTDCSSVQDRPISFILNVFDGGLENYNFDYPEMAVYRKKG